jgi:hypothetical protein
MGDEDLNTSSELPSFAGAGDERDSAAISLTTLLDEVTGSAITASSPSVS